MRDVLKSASTINGVLSVKMDGLALMQMLFVISLVFQNLVSHLMTCSYCSITVFKISDANTTGSAEFASGVGPVLVDNLICTGNEARLFDCAIGNLGATNCTRSGVAGVRCSVECTWNS